MSALVHSRVRSFPNNAAIAPYLRVKLSSGNIAAADAADDEIGVSEARTFATDAKCPVRLATSAETVRVTASEAITQYANVYAAADGKVQATDTGKRWGIALEAASGDGSVIECMRVSETETGDIVTGAIIGGDSSLGITGQAAASATSAGGAVAIAGAAGGSTSGTGGAASLTGGAGSGGGATGGASSIAGGAGDATADATVGGTGGAASVTGGAGGANTGGASGQAGGAGGAAGMTAGAGGATDSTGAHAGGAGGDVTVTAGAGGAASAGTGNGGAGGDILLVPGAGGTSSGGSAGAAGKVNVTGGVAVLQLGTAVQPGTTVGNNYLSMKATGTAPTGTGANAGHLYADFETDDDELFWLSGTGGTATQLTT